MTPEWGRAGGELPPETQFLLLELGTRGPYAVLLPLIDNAVFRATLRRRAASPKCGLACIHVYPSNKPVGLPIGAVSGWHKEANPLCSRTGPGLPM
jgi:hypothetical protein